MLLNILDIIRIVSVAIAFYFGYQIGFAKVKKLGSSHTT